jgi:hypothetical protein
MQILANGLCGTCHNLKRQDWEYFGGLREAVLDRDGYRCRVRQILWWQTHDGGASSRAWPIGPSAHDHAVSGLPRQGSPDRAVLTILPPFLVELLREQHPKGHEQVTLNFSIASPTAIAVPLF